MATALLPDPAFKARLAAGEALGCHWLSLGAPVLAEMAARAAPDAIVVDLQHGLWDRAGLEAGIAAVGAASPVLARTADASDFAIASALDAGAAGVIVPLIETAEQAARVVGAAHYPPRGRRSAGGARPLADFAAYRAACEHLVVGVMIETAAGVEAAEAIAATPGLDLVFVGPMDLSLSLGAGPGTPAFDAALGKILAACRGAGIAAGVFTGDLETALARARQGFGLVVFAHDTGLNGRAAHDRRAFRYGIAK